MDILQFNGAITSLKYQLWWLFIVIVLVVIAVLLIKLLKKPKSLKVEAIDNSKVNDFINSYGGTHNIISAELDGRRLKIKAKNIENINIDELKTLGASGIFISGDNIKMVLPYNMQKLVDTINEDLLGGKKW